MDKVNKAVFDANAQCCDIINNLIKEETMEKINIAELLKDCPKGMELDCYLFNGLEFDHIDTDNETYPIVCRAKDSTGEDYMHTFTKYGWYTSHYDYAKCVIFPKGKTTWEGFHRPYINGDIVYTIGDSIAILGDRIGEHSIGFRSYCGLFNYEFDTDVVVSPERFATEEEKAELFDVIKANGYKWNEETKTLEKLLRFKIGDKIRHKTHIRQGNVVTEIKDTHYILDDELALPFISQDEYELVSNQLVKPQFKVGDKVRHKDDKTVITITGIKDDYYFIQFYNSNKNDYQNEKVSFKDQDKYELVPNKFDITTLKPFDKVLVRDTYRQTWIADFFSHIVKEPFGGYKFACIGHHWCQCIPYEGNEHLLGTTNDCDEYFKTWK